MIVMSKFNKKAIEYYISCGEKIILPGDFVGNKFKSIEDLSYLLSLWEEKKIILLKGDKEEVLINALYKRYYFALERELEKRNGLCYKLYYDKNLKEKYIDNFLLNLSKAIKVDNIEISHSGIPDLSHIPDNIPDSEKYRIVTHYDFGEGFKREKNTIFLNPKKTVVFDTTKKSISVLA